MGFENIDIIKDATGASKETASQDGLRGGVKASEQMAQTDLDSMREYKDMIVDVGKEFKIDPALIAGIISRESRAGNALEDGWGDNGNAFGLMQVDKRWHKPVGAWDSKRHLRQATKILVDFIDVISDKFENWSEAKTLKGAIAAYNMGQDSVKSYSEVDINTTGKDYSNDVVVRAKWYKSRLFN